LSSNWQADVLHFWFALDPEQWWNGTEALDHQIGQNFRKLWNEKRELPSEVFLTDAPTALAGAILFDQFPRNMFRGHADAYSTDELALAIATRAIELGLDRTLGLEQRKFLYMPFQHSEDLGNQNRAVLLFSELGDDRQLGYAKHHHDIIEQFGRFPHRNAVLGRRSRAEEIAAGADKAW
jgi:uncharacterized protein (DUF924 family)